MDAPPCTVDEAIEAINRCATIYDGGHWKVPCTIPAGPIMTRADWDTFEAMAVVRACEPDRLVWVGFTPGKLALYAEKMIDGRCVPVVFETVHPADDATLPGHPDVFMSELAAVADQIEFGDATTFDSIAATIRAGRETQP